MFKYFPQTSDDVKQMLDKIGFNSLEDFYADVPGSIRLRHDYDLPSQKSELEIRKIFELLAKENKDLICLAGAGVYDHDTPAVVPQLVERSEYLTCYTPYQAEISQGTLQYIFEYQTMMARLTGMEVSNASMYDGSTATAEAAMMACSISRRSNIIVMSPTIDPKIRDVVKTYAHFHRIQILDLPFTNGMTDFSSLENVLSQNDVAGLIVQQPNYFGIVEDFSHVADLCHSHKALFIMNSIAADLALLKSPGEWGADIAVGEAQSLGIPMAWGGPYLGYMCTSEKYMRKMPGRIVGQTIDDRGNRAFVLTLQAREQHIRRQKATSNICSNESLMALWVTIYMAVMGKQGIKDVATLSCDGAHYLHDKLIATHRFTDSFPQTKFLNEFCVNYDGNIEHQYQKWLDNGYFGGIKLNDNTVMLAVTEKVGKEDIDRFVELVI